MKTRKKRTLQNKIINENNEGWKIIRLSGSPYVRGYYHGIFLYREFEKIKKLFPDIVKNELKENDLTKYIETCSKIIKPNVLHYPEYMEEFRGMVDACKEKNIEISVDYLIAWNSLLSMYSYYENKDVLKCSAFIATGNATKNGKIIMGHNTHSDYITGKMSNIIIYTYPEKGHPFVMQTMTGYISSGTDWFISSSGIMGCETTISKINYRPEFGEPYFCRIRKAIQYGNTLNDYAKIMLNGNAGDYACSWLFGNINTNEIMLFEIGLKHHYMEIKKNGIFYGMNSANDEILRNQETNDDSIFNLEKSNGARNHRLRELLHGEYYGTLNIDNGKLILSDHYDSYLKKNTMNFRSVCRHDDKMGSIDGKITNSYMASKMRFLGRFGSSCGKSTFTRKNNWTTIKN